MGKATEESSSLAALTKILDTEDLKLAYQPIVDLKRKTIFAYEALARPSQESFPKGPGQMFEEAARHKLAGALGRLVRQVAVAECPEYPLFLNIHPSELDQYFIVQPDDPIFRHGEDVFVEITEGVPLSHFVLCRQMLNEVQGRGIYLVVDDFGAGYSNVKYIADLEPRVVKLDRQLICGLKGGSRLFMLVKHLVQLCKAMGAKVVAEGIETQGELTAVTEAGCDYGQGYLLARPSNPPPRVQWPRVTGTHSSLTKRNSQS
jgi:EAL domain-containing protein (putative c-di-GMP-specific phosphodiesterase class I)